MPFFLMFSSSADTFHAAGYAFVLIIAFDLSSIFHSTLSFYPVYAYSPSPPSMPMLYFSRLAASLPLLISRRKQQHATARRGAMQSAPAAFYARPPTQQQRCYEKMRCAPPAPAGRNGAASASIYITAEAGVTHRLPSRSPAHAHGGRRCGSQQRYGKRAAAQPRQADAAALRSAVASAENGNATRRVAVRVTADAANHVATRYTAVQCPRLSAASAMLPCVRRKTINSVGAIPAFSARAVAVQRQRCRLPFTRRCRTRTLRRPPVAPSAA